jgi:hypothetical protein
MWYMYIYNKLSTDYVYVWRVNMSVADNDILVDKMKQLLVGGTPSVGTHAGKWDPVGSTIEPEWSMCTPNVSSLRHDEPCSVCDDMP